MKIILARLTVIVTFAVLFSGCKDVYYPMWDFPPWNIGVIVKNSAGENLLDPNVADNILDDDVVVEFNGEPYEMYDARTRFIPAQWSGLRVGEYWLGDYNGEFAMLFGQFQTEEYEKSHPRTLTIHWGDGTSDEIKFDLYVTYRKKGTESTVHRKIWLNGELQSDKYLVVEIVR